MQITPKRNPIPNFDRRPTTHALYYAGFFLVLDLILFGFISPENLLPASFNHLAIPILFALGASQIVSIVLWNWTGAGQMLKWCIALIGMFLFSLWLSQYLNSGWSQMWMVSCLLVVSARLIWGLIELQKKDQSRSLRIERFQAQPTITNFRIWNFLEWTIAAGLILSVVQMVYQNLQASILPIIGLLSFGFVTCLARLASTIVADHLLQPAIHPQHKTSKKSLGLSYGLWDSAGTLFILCAVNLCGFFWLRNSLAQFYEDSLDSIFLIAVIAQLWQLFDGIAQRLISGSTFSFPAAASSPIGVE